MASFLLNRINEMSATPPILLPQYQQNAYSYKSQPKNIIYPNRMMAQFIKESPSLEASRGMI